MRLDVVSRRRGHGFLGGATESKGIGRGHQLLRASAADLRLHLLRPGHLRHSRRFPWGLLPDTARLYHGLALQYFEPVGDMLMGAAIRGACMSASGPQAG